jgi:hypothetical protein
MKKWILFLIPLLFAGFILPQDQCKQTEPPVPQTDGPYVLYHNGKIFIYSILQKDTARTLQTDSFSLTDKSNITLSVSGGERNGSFRFPLQREFSVSPSQYPPSSKMFILSDIEGNFTGFRKLLLAGGIIDTGYNWVFGNGDLVLTGDFVDRGKQVTEVLWLIYSLEDKARAAGGRVHYILGNHEIMNMSGDLRYVQPKYLEAANLIREPYTSLYGEHSELGRWLRTKNVIERVGNILFTHGGISAWINRMNIPIDSINLLCRPYYADSTYNSYKDLRSDTLMSDVGPFWYRGYYTDTTGSIKRVIDSTIGLYGIKHITTGHTIIADTISSWYDQKVFNTDVHHASGKSEAIYYDGSTFFRILADGRKIFLASEK